MAVVVNKGITVPGFYKAGSKPKSKKRLVVAAAGAEKEGKTTFALSAPGPIALFNMDIGLEGVIEQWEGEKDIVVADFDYKDATDPTEWNKIWEMMKRNYMAALKNPDIRTLVFDTETEMWELIRLARFGKLIQVMPHHYGPVNAEYRDMIRKVYETDKNMIMLRKLKDEYVNDKSTGRKEVAGFKDIGYLVQANVVMWRRNNETGRSASLRGIEGGGGTFGITVRDCRQNASIAGDEMEEPMCSFPYLASMVFPDTDIDAWS